MLDRPCWTDRARLQKFSPPSQSALKCTPNPPHASENTLAEHHQSTVTTPERNTVNTTTQNTRKIRGRKIRLSVAAIASLSLVAAACGDDADDTAATEPAATETTEAMAPETTEAMAPETTAMDDAAMDDGPFGPACSAVPADGEGSFDGMADDPAATAASNNPLLSTLVTAVTEAGLVDTLNSEGPFTIFAPTNDAFAAIPPADLEAVLADTDLLTSILTYHVIAGESLDAAALGEAGELETVNGGTISFGTDGTTVNGANVICSNVPVANGTVHIIDAVLMPEMDEAMTATTMAEMSEGAMAPTGDACMAVPADGEGSFDGMADDPAATAASNNPVLSTLVTAVGAAGLVDTLNSEGPFTIFAPTNDAFAAIPPADLEAVLADTDLLTSILTYHVIAGESLSSAELVELGTSVTVNGGELEFTEEDGVLMVNGVAAGCQDVQVANGTVHIIGEVLMPTS